MNLKRARKNHETKRPVTNCQDEVGLIGDYLTNNLSEAESLAFEAHLSACGDCAAFLATYKKTIEVTRSLLRTGVSNQSQPRLQLRRS